MRYIEAYSEWLEQQLDDGGSAMDMNRAVKEYNAVGRGNYGPGPIYKGWAQKADHVCSHCNGVFRWQSRAIPDPMLEVLCDPCTQKAPGPKRDTDADSSRTNTPTS